MAKITTPPLCSLADCSSRVVWAAESVALRNRIAILTRQRDRAFEAALWAKEEEMDKCRAIVAELEAEGIK